MTPTEAAHWLAEHGFALLPLHWPIEDLGSLRCSCGKQCGGHAAKHPVEWLVPRGVHNASVKAAARYWHSPAAPFNIGVALGPVSGVIAFDIDPRDGGHESPAELERDLGALPTTLRVETGRGDGGFHLYFRDPGIPMKGSRGIQVKGAGGYVVGPGSRHIAGGRYRVVTDVEPAVLPEAWVEALSRPTSGYGHGSGIQVGCSTDDKHTPGSRYRVINLAPTSNPIGRISHLHKQLSNMRRPGRGTKLNFAAMAFGNMIAEGCLSWREAELFLIDACKTNGLWAFDGERSVRREIERGVSCGIECWRTN